MKISFINMVANLCEAVGADVTKVAQGMGLDPRIGPAFLNPGIGFGGFCFPKDVQAFIRIAEKSGCDFSLLKEVEKINQGRVERFVEKIRRELWVIRGKKIAMWGLAFKPNTDDVRFAPSIALAKALLAEGAVVTAYDPQAMTKAKAVVPDITYCADAYEAALGADAIVIVTEWDEFRDVDWKRVLSIVEQPLVIDGRNAFKPEEISRHGFRYVSIGRVDALPIQSAAAEETGCLAARKTFRKCRPDRSTHANSAYESSSRPIGYSLLRITLLGCIWGRRGPSIPILMYHSITDQDESSAHPYYRTKTSPDVFAAQLKYLHESGYRTCSWRDAIHQLQEELRSAAKLVVITFDDG